jgi:hypothetical protein
MSMKKTFDFIEKQVSKAITFFGNLFVLEIQTQIDQPVYECR